MTLIAAPEQLIGNDRAQSVNEVQKLISFLLETIEYFNQAERSKARLSNLHNFYTAYTLLFLQFTTSYRGVRNPLQDHCDIHHGLLLISDKDNVDGYMTRIALIAEPLHVQLQMYQQHRLNLIREMSLCNPSNNLVASFKSNIHPTLLKQIGAEELDINEIREAYPKRDTCFPFLFFINEKFQFQEAGPKTCLQILNYPGLYPNSGRHFFRSFLVHKSCRTEIIDAAMGHWNHGSEPYGPYSCLSPFVVIETIKPFINQLISECGWAPVKGYT